MIELNPYIEQTSNRSSKTRSFSSKLGSTIVLSNGNRVNLDDILRTGIISSDSIRAIFESEHRPLR